MGVEGGEGFVQQQGPRFGDQGTGQGGALALSAGQLGRILAGQRGEPEGIKPACHRRVPLAAFRMAGRVAQAVAEREGHVLVDGQMWKKRVVLKDIGQPPVLGGEADLAGCVVQGVALEPDVAGVRGEQPGDDLQRQALARSGRTDDHDPLMGGLQLHRQGEGARGGGERLSDVEVELHGDGRVGREWGRGCWPREGAEGVIGERCARGRACRPTGGRRCRRWR